MSASQQARVGLCSSLLLAAWAGCDSTAPRSAADMTADMTAGSVQVTLGTADPRRNGDTRWVDLNEGQDVELSPGAQGGFHLWLHYRVQGAAGEAVVKRQVDRVAADGSRDRVLTTQLTQTFVLGETFQTPTPLPSFMCPTPIGINVIDHAVEVTLRLETPAGAFLGQQQRRVMVHCPPDADPQRTFCLMICAG